MSTVEEEDGKVHEGTTGNLSIHKDVLLGQVPPSWPHHQRSMLQADSCLSQLTQTECLQFALGC